MQEEPGRPRLREFADRSIRWLLRTPAFLRGFLRIARSDIVDALDFERMEALDTTLIPPTLRRQEADLIFRIPFRVPATSDAAVLYVLVEHQSVEERLLPVRLLGLYWQLLELQCREWRDRGRPESELVLRPVVMVVLHTGETPWRSPLRLADLMRPEPGAEIYVPEYRVHLLDLPAEPLDVLTAGDDPTGWLLRALKQERAETDEFADAVTQAVGRLDQLPPTDEALWERGTQYLLMLVYYRRKPSEQSALWQRMQNALTTARRREEVLRMIRSYAEEVRDGMRAEAREEGRAEGRAEGEQDAARRLILTTVLERFGASTPEIDAAVRARANLVELEQLLRQVLRADRLEDVDLGQS
jgi:Putative transposase, YhgA-like